MEEKKKCRRCGEELQIKTDRWGNDPYYYCEKCDKKYMLDSDKQLWCSVLIFLICLIALVTLVHYLVPPYYAAALMLVLFGIPVVLVLYVMLRK